jgi:hypothetical protein
MPSRAESVRKAGASRFSTVTVACGIDARRRCQVRRNRPVICPRGACGDRADRRLIVCPPCEIARYFSSPAARRDLDRRRAIQGRRRRACQPHEDAIGDQACVTNCLVSAARRRAGAAGMLARIGNPGIPIRESGNPAQVFDFVTMQRLICRGAGFRSGPKFQNSTSSSDTSSGSCMAASIHSRM